MNLPPRPPRRHESRDITRPVEIALNAMPGVQVWVNVTGVYCLPNSPGRVRVGLGVGGADLVGEVQMMGMLMAGWMHWATDAEIVRINGAVFTRMPPIARFFALETKQRGKYARPDQRAWARVVRAQGGFCCVVRSAEEATRAVERCRAGASE